MKEPRIPSAGGNPQLSTALRIHNAPRQRIAQLPHTSLYWRRLRATYANASSPRQPPATTPKGGDLVAGSAKLSIHQPQWTIESPRERIFFWLSGTPAMLADQSLAFDLRCFAGLISPGPRLADSSTPDALAPPGLCWFFRSADLLWEYATFIRPSGKGAVTAHVWLYELLHGPITKAERVDHLCEVKRCVNPDHLEAVSNSTNVKRSIDRKRARGE